MTYDGAMVMPRNCVAMTKDEMTYVEGGVSIPVSAAMLLKPYCLGVGLSYAKATGLSAARVAVEVYAHARLFYGSLVASVAYAAISRFTGLASSTVKSGLDYIRTHSNPIDIGGDSATRVAIYNAIWALF